MFKKSLLALGLLVGGNSFAAETAQIGAVNFATCITESKFGKKEQENFENLRKQMSSLVETTEKQIKEISGKLEDPEYHESLSPKAEEELKVQLAERQDEMNRYQNQFYQVLQHANYQMLQKMNQNIAAAAEKVAKQQNLSHIVNRELCFYIAPELDVTNSIIAEMDQSFEFEEKQQEENNLSDNQQQPSSEEKAE